MVQALTGKYQDPSEAWGYKDPKGFWENVANIGIDLVADPMNVVPGLGFVANKVGDFSKVMSKVSVPKSKINIKDLASNYDKYVRKSGDSVKDFYNKLPKSKIEEYKKVFNTLDPSDLKEFTTVAKNKNISPFDAFVLLNDVIDIKEGGNQTNRLIPYYKTDTMMNKNISSVSKSSNKIAEKPISKPLVKKPQVKKSVVLKPTRIDSIVNKPIAKKLDTTYWHESPFIKGGKESQQLTRQEFEQLLQNARGLKR